jgi:hypothetical protein
VQYTGVADLGGTPTDPWLAQHFAAAGTLSAAFDTLPDIAGQAIRSDRSKRGMPLAFVAAGYAFFDNSVIPFRRITGNFRLDNLRLLSPAADRFDIAHFELKQPHAFFLDSAGVPVVADRRRTLMRNIARVMKRHGDLSSIVRLIVDQMRGVADHDERVGKDLMLSILPLSAVKPDYGEHLVLTGGPSDATPTFFHIPEDASTPVRYGPNFVCGGSTSTGFSMRPLTPAETAEGEVEAREWRRSQAPQHVYITRVLEEKDAAGRRHRRPDIAAGVASTNYYHGDEVLVLTGEPVDHPIRELLTADDVVTLKDAWGDDLPPTDHLLELMGLHACG